MKRKKEAGARVKAVYDRLFDAYGTLECFLTHKNPYELLIATVLSAQCTDLTVNKITPRLFLEYPDARSMAGADVKKLRKLIYSTGFYRSKSENIIKISKILAEKYDSEVPRAMDSLLALPGVGRKTANVVLGNAFGIPGFPVDTHVKRILLRTGLADSKDPEKIEAFVNEKIPASLWTNFSHLLISHGRKRCGALKPDCENCEISALCDFGQAKREGHK
jgi:endonuclease-3